MVLLLLPFKLSSLKNPQYSSWEPGSKWEILLDYILIRQSKLRTQKLNKIGKSLSYAKNSVILILQQIKAFCKWIVLHQSFKASLQKKTFSSDTVNGASRMLVFEKLILIHRLLDKPWKTYALIFPIKNYIPMSLAFNVEISYHFSFLYILADFFILNIYSMKDSTEINVL